MPSTTATTLASNRRRLRLAQHTRALSPSPEPIDMSSVASSSSNKNKKSSNGNSPAPSPTLTLDLSNSNSPDNTSNTSFNNSGKKKQSRSRSSQHGASSSSQSQQQQQQSQQQQQQQQHNSTSSSNNNSRGRSRRSRAATRRTTTNTNAAKSSSSINDDPTMMHTATTHTHTMSRQQEILAGLDDVETAARDSSISRVSQQQIVNDNNNMSQQHNNNNFEDERLNLHVTDSIDSDDNGTCFNSIGTTTPRQQVVAPQPPPHSSQANNKRIENNVYQPNLEDEDNNKTSDKVIFSSVNNIEVAQSNRTYHALDNERGKNISQRKRSTHKIDTSAASSNSKNLSPLHENAPQSSKQQSSSIEQRHLERTLHNRNQVRKGSIWDHPEDMVSNNVNNNKKDDNSTAYAEFEQDGNSYSRRPHRGGTTARRGAGGGGGSIESSKYDMDEKMLMENAMGLANNNEEGEGEGDNDNGVLLSGQNMKTALGVGAAATLGAFVLGPVGLLVGAASVGIGMGVLQIPEEQRTNVKNHAATSFEKAKHIACNLNESMATGCAKYSGTDPSEVATVVGKVVPEEIMDTCGCYGSSTNGDGEDREKSNRYQQHGGDDGGQSLTGTDLDIRSQGSSPIANAVNGVERGMNRLVGDVFGDEQQQSPVSQSMNVVGGGGGDTKGRGLDGVGGHANENEDAVGRRVACGRKGRVVPLSQIHSLRPSLQPRAWLDVMASAHTTRDDKNEAMQEILILAKDKEISRWLLEEGILDSLMYILSNYFRNYSSFLRNETPTVVESEKEEPFKSYKKGGNAFYHAKLASNCCVALGKAYCASVHTEGDLLLMSAYSRGSVPVERQLAQMLFEVPHHMRVINTASTAGNASSEALQHDVEFTLTELSMQQAEDLASSIKSLDDGKIDV